MASPERFLTKDEVLLILRDLHRRKKRSIFSHENLIIFRLSCCAGLRRKEISGLRLADLVLAGPRPVVLVRKITTKGTADRRRSRTVPLWWDAGTLEDIKEWVDWRRTKMNAAANDPVIPGLSEAMGNRGEPLTPDLISRRWTAAIRCLGEARRRQLSVHCGRHSFASLSKLAGHSSIEIRDAVGHTNEATTNLYLHAVQSENVPDVFAA